MRVYVNEGRIVRIEGEERNPVSKGKLCAKPFAAIQLEYDPRRLTHPLKRVGEKGAGQWKKITWNEALDTVQSKIREIVNQHGPEAVAWHRGTAPRWGSNWVINQRFMNVFGSPNLTTHNHICHTPRVLGYMHTFGKMPSSDYQRAKCILLWGHNPAETQLPIDMPRILEAKERGATLVVIDPCFTRTASKADIFIQPRPGTDGALALGIMNVIINENLYDEKFVEKWTVGFEELRAMVEEFTPSRVEPITGVSQAAIEEVSRVYATKKPATLQEGNGVDQHTNVVQTTRALACLMAITGNLGIPGGNIVRPSIGLADLSLRGRIKNAFEKSISTHPLYYNEPSIGLVGTPEVVDAILTGKPYPIRALFVQASAIGVIESNNRRLLEALRKVEFLVVHDVFMTATAELADIVLPAATFLEQSLLITREGPEVESTFIGMINETIEPIGEAWPDSKLIFELAKRLGFREEFKWNNVDEFFNEELAPLGLTVEEIRMRPEGILLKFGSEEVFKAYEEKGFNTPSGKVELYSRTFENYGFNPLPIYVEPAESPVNSPDILNEYPMVCGTGIKPGLFTHSRYRTLPWLKEIMPEPFVLINVLDAKALGIENGDFVKVESRRGAIKLRAKVTLTVKEGVAMLTHGWGQPYAGGGPISNILTDDQERCPISGATGNRSFLCRISRAE
jgi:anaerobic selenocysteine-containing dehydrogenase